MKAKYAGMCALCQKPFDKGDDIKRAKPVAKMLPKLHGRQKQRHYTVHKWAHSKCHYDQCGLEMKEKTTFYELYGE